MEAILAGWPFGGMVDSNTALWPAVTDHYSDAGVLYRRKMASWGP